MNKYLQNYSYDISGTILAGSNNVTTTTSIGNLRGRVYVEYIVISNYLADNTNALAIPGYVRVIILNGNASTNFATSLPGLTVNSSVVLTYTTNFSLYAKTGFQINSGDQLRFQCRWMLNATAVNDVVGQAYINLVGYQIE